jgi:hypothetical protein
MSDAVHRSVRWCLWPTLVVALACASAPSAARQFYASAAQLVAGVSTQADVQAQFGPPRTTLDDGKVWAYGYPHRVKATGPWSDPLYEQQRVFLSVTFDATGVVERFEITGVPQSLDAESPLAEVAH